MMIKEKKIPTKQNTLWGPPQCMFNCTLPSKKNPTQKQKKQKNQHFTEKSKEGKIMVLGF